MCKCIGNFEQNEVTRLGFGLFYLVGMFSNGVDVLRGDGVLVQVCLNRLVAQIDVRNQTEVTVNA